MVYSVNSGAVDWLFEVQPVHSARTVNPQINFINKPVTWSVIKVISIVMCLSNK